MQLISVHLYDPEVATTYVRALQGETSPDWPWWQSDMPALIHQVMEESAANRISTGLALAMADLHPPFATEGFGLPPWEAQCDRGIGMIMRPPARAFVDNGVHPLITGKMPIRLDLQGGIMAGAWIPPHLIGHLDELIENRVERWAKRIHDAEMDPYPLLITMRMATDVAIRTGLGQIEAINIIGPDTRIVEIPTRKKMDAAFRARIDTAIMPEKKGRFGGWFSRG